MARGKTTGGKISRGNCEVCKVDLGNRLDPYCWPCHAHLERIVEQRMQARREERLREAEPAA